MKLELSTYPHRDAFRMTAEQQLRMVQLMKHAAEAYLTPFVRNSGWEGTWSVSLTIEGIVV